jgi:predicted AAA+ superfamily ATPase
MYTRKIISKIEPFLETHDILLFYWARQVGKTSLMKIIQNDYIKEKSVFFNLENVKHFRLLDWDYDKFIENLKVEYNWNEKEKIVVFIDEVQYLNNPTNFLKYIYDEYENIKFIVSGSSTLDIRWKMKDSLAGRLLKFDIFPLSFEEFLIFKWEDNLAKLVWNKIEFETINSKMKLYFEEFLKFWWYPKVVLTDNVDSKKVYLEQIFDLYIQKDIRDIGRIKEVGKFNKLLMVFAEQSWNLVNLSEITRTTWISINTLNDWILLLENTFVLKFITPFSWNVRWEVIKMPKVFYIDNWIRNYIEDNFEITGNSFENAFFAYIENAYKAKNINFYRMQDKQEIDFVLDWKPFELKVVYNWKNLTALNNFKVRFWEKWSVVTFEKKGNEKYEILFPWEV